MQTMNISLPEPLKKFVDHQITEGRYSSVSEYIRELIRDDEKRRAEGRLEALLLEGRLIKEFRPRYNVSFRDDKRFLLVKVDQREEVLVDGVDPAAADEPHEVDRPAALFGVLAGIDEHRVLEERPVPDRRVDADEVLHHHATRAEVQVTHLTIAHLAGWEADGEPRGV